MVKANCRTTTNATEALKSGFCKPYEFRVRTRTGESKWVLETVISINYRGKRATQGNFMDITERKLEEQVLKISELKFRNLIENSPLGISLTTVDGRFLSFNKAMLEMYGYDSGEELQGEPIASRYADEEDRKQLLQRLEKDGFVKDLELRMKRKNGQFIWCSICSISQVSESGETYIISTIGDITRRKEMEAAL
jgi:PAS domain S-box-containing protein